MPSLNDSWQQQHQQRKQALIQRKQEVCQLLTRYREMRQVTALQQQRQRQSSRQTLARHHYHRQHVAQQAHVARLTEVKARRQEMQNYLTDISLVRQIQTEELQQKLAQSRAVRTAVMQTLFQDFAEFRVELQQFRSQLSMTVWGRSTSAS
jgi:hypothetical protein